MCRGKYEKRIADVCSGLPEKNRRENETVSQVPRGLPAEGQSPVPPRADSLSWEAVRPYPRRGDPSTTPQLLVTVPLVWREK